VLAGSRQAAVLAAALRSLAGFAGASRLIARRENSAAAVRELGRLRRRP
jgi:hypothetical protein